MVSLSGKSNLFMHGNLSSVPGKFQMFDYLLAHLIIQWYIRTIILAPIIILRKYGSDPGDNLPSPGSREPHVMCIF